MKYSLALFVALAISASAFAKTGSETRKPSADAICGTVTLAHTTDSKTLIWFIDGHEVETSVGDANTLFLTIALGNGKKRARSMRQPSRGK